MFYVLNFIDKEFYTCHTVEEVKSKIKELFYDGVYEEAIEIVNAFDDEIRYSTDEFNECFG